MISKNDYWWAEKDPKEVVKFLAPYNDHGRVWSNNPIYQTWYRNYYIYYSPVIRPNTWDSGLIFSGRQGELIEMMVPQARSIIRNIIDVVTKNKLFYKCVADSSKQSVIKTTRLGNALCKKIVRNQNLDNIWARALESEFLTGLGFTHTRWRTDKGGAWEADDQGVMHFKGDVEISQPSVWDVTFDGIHADHKNWIWAQVREIHNRWDLIAQAPDLKDKILALPSVRDVQGAFIYQGDRLPSDDDSVYVYYAYHDLTPALPKGRMIIYGDEHTIFADRINYYGEIPIKSSRSEAITNSGYGMPLFSSLLPIQEMLDTVASSNATNISTFGVQNIIAPRGSNINYQQLLGMNFIMYTPTNAPNGGKPEPLQLTASAPESWKMLEFLDKYFKELSRVNSALRGDPPSQVSSGTAIATLTATAIESLNSASKESKAMMKHSTWTAIKCYRVFASVPHEIEMEGIGSQKSTESFIGEDLDGIKDIEIQEVNALMQTYSGRIEIARDILNSNPTNIRAYYSVLEGAPPEEMYKKELSQQDLVNLENEALLNGEDVPVLSTDDHPFHIMQHAITLNDPKVRLDGKTTPIILQHLLKHYEISKTVDPALAAMIATGKLPDPTLLPPSNDGGGGQRSIGPGPKAPSIAEPAKDLLNREDVEIGGI